MASGSCSLSRVGSKRAFGRSLNRTSHAAVPSGYEAAYQWVRALVQLFMPFMGEPEGAAEVIAKALTVKVPHARYLVGRDAQVIAASQPFLPAAVRDRVTRFLVGL